jgi:nucleoside-diphosphate kinase
MTTKPCAAPTPSDETATGIDWSRWTVILLKPDCLARNLVRPVLAMVARHVRVTAERIVHPTAEQVFTHYADILPLSAELGVDVAEDLRRIYLGHPVAVALGHGTEAATRLRAVLGPTDPAEAGPDTIRGRFGTDTLDKARSEGRLIDNLIHSSDHVGVVARDLAIWFGPGATALLTPSPDLGGSIQ